MVVNTANGIWERRAVENCKRDLGEKGESRKSKSVVIADASVLSA